MNFAKTYFLRLVDILFHQRQYEKTIKFKLIKSSKDVPIWRIISLLNVKILVYVHVSTHENLRLLFFFDFSMIHSPIAFSFIRVRRALRNGCRVAIYFYTTQQDKTENKGKQKQTMQENILHIQGHKDIVYDRKTPFQFFLLYPYWNTSRRKKLHKDENFSRIV